MTEYTGCPVVAEPTDRWHRPAWLPRGALHRPVQSIVTPCRGGPADHHLHSAAINPARQEGSGLSAAVNWSRLTPSLWQIGLTEKFSAPAWIFVKLDWPVSIRRKPGNRTCAGSLARLMSGPAFQAGVKGTSRARRINAMAGVAQLVRAPVCGTGGRRFETGHSPHFSRHGASSVVLCRVGTTLRAWRNW